MKTKNSFQLLAEYSAVFNSAYGNLEKYLTGISQSTLLKIATHLLALSNDQTRSQDYGVLLSEFFSPPNQAFGNSIFQKLNQISKGNRSMISVFNKMSLLKLFEFCFNRLSDEQTQSESESEINVFKAILAINEQMTVNESNATSSTETLPQEIRSSAFFLTLTYPNSVVLNYRLNEVLIAQFIKSIYLFEWLESREDMRPLMVEFLKHFEFQDWKSFLKEVMHLTSFILKPQREGATDLEFQKNEDKETGNLIEKLALIDGSINEELDFIKIRSKPFYKLSENVYRIIFDLFLVELIYKSLYFKLTEVNNLLGKGRVNFDRRGIFCDEFSEKWLLYKTLEAIYESKYIKYNGAQIKELGIDGEPDYYIRNGNHIYLFESKDFLISAKIKDSQDFALYEPELKKTLYYENKGSGKIKAGAVLQLIRSIERVLLKKFSFDTKYKERNIEIYPIIITHDDQYDLLGLNRIVNYWFQEELNKLSKKGINVSKVKPVTILNIDTLIIHQDLLKEGVIKMDVILDEYFKSVILDRKKHYRDEGHARDAYNSTQHSFAHFTRNFIGKQGTFRPPKMFMKKGLTLFN